jgi:hypothetical protein
MRPEDALQSSIVAFLERALPSCSYFASIPNGAHLAGDPKRRARAMATLKATGLRPGAPDLFVVHEGRFLGLEVKTEKGRLQDSQRSAADDITGAGGAYSVVRSIDDVCAVLSAWGVPLRASVAA